jgi:hypothetical protein
MACCQITWPEKLKQTLNTGLSSQHPIGETEAKVKVQPIMAAYDCRNWRICTGSRTVTPALTDSRKWSEASCQYSNHNIWQKKRKQSFKEELPSQHLSRKTESNINVKLLAEHLPPNKRTQQGIRYHLELTDSQPGPQTINSFHFIYTVHLFIIDLFVPTNALRQFFHCLLYHYDAPIRISTVILPSSGGILSEFLHRPIL